MTHWRSANDESRSCWMLGSATFTIVMSSSSMKVPRQTAARVHHFGSLEPARLVVVVVTALTSASCRSIAALSFGGVLFHDRPLTSEPWNMDPLGTPHWHRYAVSESLQ